MKGSEGVGGQLALDEILTKFSFHWTDFDTPPEKTGSFKFKLYPRDLLEVLSKKESESEIRSSHNMDFDIAIERTEILSFDLSSRICYEFRGKWLLNSKLEGQITYISIPHSKELEILSFDLYRSRFVGSIE